MSVTNSVNAFFRASDKLNADQLADALVEGGKKIAGPLGQFVAAGLGVGAAAGGIYAIMSQDTANPLHTLGTELPNEVRATQNTGAQVATIASNVLEAAAEMAALALIANFAVQSVDAWRDARKA